MNTSTQPADAMSQALEDIDVSRPSDFAMITGKIGLLGYAKKTPCTIVKTAQTGPIGPLQAMLTSKRSIPTTRFSPPKPKAFQSLNPEQKMGASKILSPWTPRAMINSEKRSPHPLHPPTLPPWSR